MSGENMKQNPLTEDFGVYVKELLNEWKVPGVSVAVVNGEETFSQGYGIATFPNTPATPETLWNGASTTKAFLGATIAQLIDTKAYPEILSRGWSTPISSIIRDDFVLQDAWATQHITLEDAISHRTGMPRHDKSCFHIYDGKVVTVGDVVRNLRNLPLNEEPRVKFQYCNIMYATLTHVVETLTGKWFGDTLKELIWEPLGMKSSFFNLAGAKEAPEQLAMGYNWDEEKEIYTEVEHMPLDEVGGAGAIISNVVDYAKWIKCLLHEEAPFSKDAHKDIRSPRILESLPRMGRDVSLYTLGWERFLYRGHEVYTHSGGQYGFGALVVWLPGIKFGAVAFANTAFSSNAVVDSMLLKLVDDKINTPLAERFDHSKRYREIQGKMIDAYDKAVDIIYPNRPDPPLPPTIKAEDLAGDYFDPGYKNITLEAKPHPDRPNQVVLVADRSNSTWKASAEMHHVTGDWWVMYMRDPTMNVPFAREALRAKFKIGPDGKPTALEVDLKTTMDPQSEGKVLFVRRD